jgi:Fe-S-cluster containining protein
MYDYYYYITADKLKIAKKELKVLYSDIPETEGCKENIPNNCGAWCCQIQSPQVLLSEFLHSWTTIKSSWKKEQIIQLLQSAVKNYLNTGLVKGCVFWNKESKLCNQHHTRPFNCRTYSQIPDEEFKPRYERLKVLYPNEDLRDQCGLTKTVGNKPTKEDIDRWFEWLKIIDREMGVDPKLIHDGDGGLYRTYHDHILLYLGSDMFLSTLTRIRLKSTEDEKLKFIEKIPENILLYFPNLW